MHVKVISLYILCCDEISPTPH